MSLPNSNALLSKQNGRKKPQNNQQSGGVVREDSDDELGLEDHPWIWIYSDDSRHMNGQDSHIQSGKDDMELNGSQGQIVGARMGGFECYIGDCLLLKAEGTHEAWVGILCEFLEADGEKSGNFMWFCSEKEIRNKAKKRSDFLTNELYISPSYDQNPLTSINGKAVVVSHQKFLARYPNGKVPKHSPDYGKIFICRRGCNTRTITYTEPFIWEDIYKGASADVDSLIQFVESNTKASRKRPNRKHEAIDIGDSPLTEADSPATPRKRQKTAQIRSPSVQAGSRTPQGPKTPTSKRVKYRKPLEFTPLGTRILSSTDLFSSPYKIARNQLHVSSVPAVLPCRETEYATVYSHLESAIAEGTGSCIYISGTPGTGKTATVREVVAQLNASVVADELDDFIFVEINGMKITDPHQAYSLLWEALRGERVSPSHALDLLNQEFSNPSPRRVPCVVLMDELDQLVTKNQSVMYNFFNWPGLRHSRLIVLAIANTMDLPERTLSNKISSRLGLTRITFPGYVHDQLMKIIESRLEDVPGAIMEPDAIQFASRKVAAVSGDARRALDICRRAVEIAEGESLDADNVPETPSKSSKRQNVGKRARVTIATIKQAINEATSTPTQRYLRNLPLSSKLLLGAILAMFRRTGLIECNMGEVIDEAKRIGTMADNTDVHNYLLAREVLADDRQGKPAASTTTVKTSRALGMSIAAMELAEAGILSLEARKGERTGRVRLNVGEEEVKQALKDDVASRGLGLSGA